MWAGGYSNQNVIAYITMSTLGDTTDFGDLTQGRYNHNSMSSPTRCVHGAGRYYDSGFINTNIMDYVQIATTGNALDFGDMAIYDQ